MAANRLIIDQPASGAWNMAVDEALLIDAADSGAATLRFYQWQEPTLSLGYFQRYDDRDQHPASRECAVVRRQTGGGAILHDRELTYSLTLPASHPLARQSQQLYAAVHDEFIAELAAKFDVGAPLFFSRNDQESSLPPREEPFLCFERRAPDDVLLVEAGTESNTSLSDGASPVTGWKILGSAQRRRWGAILQHGGLLLERSPAAPQLPGVCDLTGLNVAVDDLLPALSLRLANAFHVEPVATNLPPQLQSIARELANNKYGTPSWTKRR